MINIANNRETERAIARLMARATIAEPIEKVTPMQAGGNNRAYRVETANGCYAVKHYFQHPGDPRDRLQAEYALLDYAERAGIAAVPHPLLQDPHSGMALYEYIEGEALQRDEVGRPEVEAAVAFLQALNREGARQRAGVLPAASEAAFSLAEHLQNIERRVRQLQQITQQDKADREGARFIESMVTFWNGYRARLEAEVERLGWGLDESLPLTQRCISPSDFGFHNAIRTPQGEIRFIDFEYAGWDDPAKTIADFFSQPAVPVPLEYYDYFESSVLALFESAEVLQLRTRLLWPAHQIKWCCITLNVFLPIHMERRRFANPQLDPIALKREQLSRAHTLFQTIKESSYGLH